MLIAPCSTSATDIAVTALIHYSQITRGRPNDKHKDWAYLLSQRMRRETPWKDAMKLVIFRFMLEQNKIQLVFYKAHNKNSLLDKQQKK